MATTEQTQIVKFQGGLQLSSTELDAVETPGFCEAMINFEADIRGGYRRVDGFVKLGAASATTPGVVDANIKMVATTPFFTGNVSVRDGKVWFSEDGITWVQVNKDTSGAYVDAATLAGLGDFPRTTTGLEGYSFASWHNGTDEELVFTDNVGSNPLARFSVRDNAGTLEYRYIEATAADWGGVARFPSTISVLGDRFLYGKDPAFKASAYNTGLFDPFGFVAGGEVNIADEVEHVQGFRENAIVFGRNSIHSWTDIGDVVNEAVIPITSNMGCVAGRSVQEVGGDLIFLSHDGLRTIAGTAKINDTELGAMSFEINKKLLDYIEDIDSYHVSSVVIRKRSNYRLFFHNKLTTTESQKGVGGVLRRAGNGATWEWNELNRIPVWDIHSRLNSSGIETIHHVANTDRADNAFIHNGGLDFDGSSVYASFKVPYITFGDPELRKTLYKMRVYGKGEGSAWGYGFKIGYDTDDANAHSPAVYVTDTTLPPASYGLGAYATAVYGGGTKETLQFSVEGSGKAFDLSFVSAANSAPFTIQGVSVLFQVNGRN